MEAALRRAGAGAAGAAGRRQRSCWDNWVFALAWRVLSGSSLFVRSFFPALPRAVTPLEAHRAFLLSYEAEYGGFHPALVEGVLLDALVRAKRECKFLLVYLHSSQHGDTDAFCRVTLASEAVVQFVDRNLVMWAADVATPAGQQAASSLGANSFPYLALLYLQGESERGQEIRCLGTWIGPLTVDELLVRLMGAQEEHEAVLVADRAETEERERTRHLLRQQDRDYEESLRADKRKREQQQQQQQQQAQAQQQPKHKEEEVDEPVAVASPPPPAPAKVAVPPEPAHGEPGAVRVAFRLPQQRTERRFRGTDSLAVVFAFVDSKLEGGPQRFKLVSAYPRVVYRRSDARSLEEAGVGNAVTLIFEEEED